MRPSDLPRRQPALWRAATAAPFLTAVRNGTLPEPVLAGWLAQDALFVADLLAFQARLLARAPRPAQPVLAGGCIALVDELDWFEQLATRRGLTLDVAPSVATLAYRALLQRLDHAAYDDALAALWLLERVYLDAWTGARSDDTPCGLLELVRHWTTPEFAGYVGALQRLADAVSADEPLLVEVLQAEASFWPDLS